MAYRGGRGGGRGRGRGPGSFSFAKKEPFILFPDTDLPKISSINKHEEALIIRDTRLRNYWRNSPYYIQQEDEDHKLTQVHGGSGDIERYSDTHNISSNHKEKQLPFSYYMKLYSGKFPEELLRGKKRVGHQHQKKKVQVWDTDEKEKKAYDFFEKLEKSKGEKGDDDDDNEKKKKGDGEKDEDDEGGGEEEDGEISDDGDYNENEYFDDDEDDFNMDDGVDEVEDNMF